MVPCACFHNTVQEDAPEVGIAFANAVSDVLIGKHSFTEAARRCTGAQGRKEELRCKLFWLRTVRVGSCPIQGGIEEVWKLRGFSCFHCSGQGIHLCWVG